MPQNGFYSICVFCCCHKFFPTTTLSSLWLFMFQWNKNEVTIVVYIFYFTLHNKCESQFSWKANGVKSSCHKKCQRIHVLWPNVSWYKIVEAMNETMTERNNTIQKIERDSTYEINMCASSNGGWQALTGFHCTKYNAVANTHYEKNARITRTHVSAHTISLKFAV